MDLVALEVEDVVCLVEEPVADQQLTELPGLVPEQRVVPVLDVEVVALDVGEDQAREAERLVEGLARVVL